MPKIGPGGKRPRGAARPVHRCGKGMYRLYYTKYNKKVRGSVTLPCRNWMWCAACGRAVDMRSDDQEKA